MEHWIVSGRIADMSDGQVTCSDSEVKGRKSGWLPWVIYAGHEDEKEAL